METELNRFNRIYTELHASNGRMMVVSHRGDWLDAPENSLLAIRNAITLGADMIEIDVERSKDGKLVLMHDKTVDRMTDGSGTIAELTLVELKALRLKQSKGGAAAQLTQECIPTLEEVMNLVKGKAMVNLDKCWDIREDVYRVLRETNTLDHALFKSEADIEEISAFLNDKPIRPLYMHIIDQDNTHVLPDPDIIMAKLRPIAIEFVFREEGRPFAIEEAFRLFEGKCRVWMNTMKDIYCAGHSDATSLKNADDGWGWGIERKVNMIQTDYAKALLNYLQTRGHMCP